MSLMDGSPSNVSTIQYINMDSKGDSKDFGDLLDGATSMNACSSKQRLVWGGGNIGPSKTNKMEYVHFSTLGNGIDFGDLSQGSVQNPSACSNGHGGVH